jgi:hypothetical protein
VALPGLLGAGGATAGTVAGQTAATAATAAPQAGLLGQVAAEQAAAPVVNMSTQAGLLDKANYAMGNPLSQGGWLDTAGKFAKTALPIMTAVEATRPPEQPMMQSPVVQQRPASGPEGLSQVVQAKKENIMQSRDAAMQRRMAQRARLQRMMGG